jgi:preprotein translocase SecE subunit
MDTIKNIVSNIQNQITQTEWTPDNITKVILVLLAILLVIITSIKKSPVRRYLESVIREVKLIEWLKLKDVIRYTFIVLLVSLIAVAIITPLDAGLILLKETYLFK